MKYRKEFSTSTSHHVIIENIVSSSPELTLVYTENIKFMFKNTQIISQTLVAAQLNKNIQLTKNNSHNK